MNFFSSIYNKLIYNKLINFIIAVNFYTSTFIPIKKTKNTR